VTLTLTSDDLEGHIVVNVSSTLTNTIWFVAALCFIVDVRTYSHPTFLPGLLGHLSGDDLTTLSELEGHFCRASCYK